MHFAIASDYAGSHLQQFVLEALGHSGEDLGSSNTPTVDYPDPARTIAAAIFTDRAERAVLCGREQLTNHKLGCVTTPTPPNRVRSTTHRNALVLRGRLIGKVLAHELTHTLLNARHSREEPAPAPACQRRPD